MTSVMETEYKEWLMNKASTFMFPDGPYSQLFEYLYSVTFYSNVGNDINRAADGLELRARFVSEGNKWSHRDIYMYMGNKDCSVLEMMIALAIRCEDDIMYNKDYGDRTGIWFRTMLNNLGLIEETDDAIDICYVSNVISRLLSHTYKRNGEGGMFPIYGTHRNMPNTEIWYQMCYYLNSLIDELT